jgi:hypothetical protein|tara:strand:- start:1347 stop:2495 length:1149 start_codon:yes stop_codon:yes gene_type:complete
MPINRYETALLMSKKYLSQYIWIGVFLTILGVFWYYRMQINKKTDNDNIMEKEYDDKSLSPQLSSINTGDPKYNDSLVNFYIASSYNSCCAGDFQDSYVTLKPLEEIIFHGARVLDFEIYSIDGTAQVAASPFPNPNIKGTYNSIPIEEVLNKVSNLAFSSGTSANANDPLFLHFRIKSNRQDVYTPLAKSIINNFAGRLLDARWSFEGRGSANNTHTENLALEPLISLAGKVIILAHQDNDNYKDESNPFYELVNLGSNSTYFKQLRNTDIQYAASPANLKTYNKQRVALTMPDWSEINTNVPVALHQSYGCQMVCMNYQNLDKNMKYYLDFFNNAGCAFVKKPPYLCYVQKKITCATPPSKDLSFAPKKYEVLPGMSIHM